MGTRFEQNRAQLEQDAFTILTNAATDTLPGITPAKISAGHLAIKAYKDSNVTQTTAQGDASDQRTDLSTLLRGINAERISL